jgi:hypothetical protein
MGTVFSFGLDQPATVKIAIQRVTLGRRVGRSCKPPSHELRQKRRCIPTVTIATLIRSGHVGSNKVAFTGRIGGMALKPGRYRAVFSAVNAAGKSAPQTLGLHDRQMRFRKREGGGLAQGICSCGKLSRLSALRSTGERQSSPDPR